MFNKIVICLISIMLLSSCGDGDNLIKKANATTPLSITEIDTGDSVSWNELAQYFNGVPKYSGAVGTYSYKHYPISVAKGGNTFHVFSDNTQDNNLYIYVVKDKSNPVLVHTYTNWSDPHSNAVINVRNDGHVEVYVSARHTKKSAYKYVSQTPMALDFVCVEGCSGTFMYEAYPQVHNPSWGTTLLYTHYIHTGYQFKSRLLHVKLNGNSYRLSDSPAYQVSEYQDGELCTAHNYLVDGIPDKRTNIYFMCTDDGQNWYDKDNTPLMLPLPDDINNTTKVFDTHSKNRFTFVKDIYKHDGKWRVLFVSSTSIDPTTGNRWLYEWVQGQGVKYITSVDHNYGGISYLVHDGQLYYASTESDVQSYLSGKLQILNTSGKVVTETTNGGYAYVRRVVGRDSELVASRQDSEDHKSGNFYFIKVD